MSKRVSKKMLRELTFLAALDKAEADVDVSDIPEVQDWSGAVVGRFYGASVEKSSRATKLLSSLSQVFRPGFAIQQLGLREAIAKERTKPFGSSHLSGARSQTKKRSEVTPWIGSTYTSMTNPELVAECTLRMGAEPWREFIRRSQPVISAIVLATARRYEPVSRELVDDLVQDVYVNLLANECRVLRNFRALNEGSLWAFLKVLAANATQDYFRKAVQKRAKAYAQELVEEAPEATEVERNLLLADIDRALKTHSHEPNFERDKKIFWLYYQQGYTAREIASLSPQGLTVKGIEEILFLLTRQISSELQGTKRKPAT